MNVSKENLLAFKYWLCINRVGKACLWKLFCWGFKKNSTVYEALLASPGFSNATFRSWFDGPQRKKIQDGDSNQFDIPIVHKLLQKLCGVSEDAQDSLNKIIIQLKRSRNHVSHSGRISINMNEFESGVDALKILVEDLVDEGAKFFHVENYEAKLASHELINDLDSIQNVSLPKISFEEQMAVLTECGRAEISRWCKGYTFVKLCSWLQGYNGVCVSSIFVEPVIMRNQKEILQYRVSPNEECIKVSDILDTKLPNGDEPDIRLIVGSRGYGKSSLLSYVLHQWINNEPTSPAKLNEFEILFYVDCHNYFPDTINDLLARRIPQTIALLGSFNPMSLLSGLSILVVADNVDSDLSSLTKLFRLFDFNVTRIKFLMASSLNIGQEISKLSYGKRVQVMELRGLLASGSERFVKSLHQSLAPTLRLRHDDWHRFFEEDAYALSQLLMDCRFFSPELLALSYLQWQDSHCKPSKVTVTSVYYNFINHLIDKARSRILKNSACQTVGKYDYFEKIQVFIVELGRLAFKSKCERNARLDSSAIKHLKAVCTSSGLPPDIIIEEFIICKEETDSYNSVVLTAEFVSNTMQDFFCSLFLSHQISEGEGRSSLWKYLNGKTSSVLQKPLTFLLGLLAIKSTKLLQEVAPTIIKLMNKCRKIKDSNEWLKLIQECWYNPTVTKEILRTVGDEWTVEDYAISKPFVNLLQQYCPKMLNITVYEDPSNTSCLEETLRVCLKSKVKTLSLLLYQHFWKDDGKYSDKYFKAGSFQVSSVELTKFAGRLSNECIHALPSSLCQLFLRVDMDQISHINGKIQQMRKLEILYLNFDIGSESDMPDGKIEIKKVKVNVGIWGVNQGLISKCVVLLKRLSTPYNRVTLRGTRLDETDAKHWMQFLADGNVQVAKLVIGSYLKLDSETQESLLNFAKKLTFKDFQWINI